MVVPSPDLVCIYVARIFVMACCSDIIDEPYNTLRDPSKSEFTQEEEESEDVLVQHRGQNCMIDIIEHRWYQPLLLLLCAFQELYENNEQRAYHRARNRGSARIPMTRTGRGGMQEPNEKGADDNHDSEGVENDEDALFDSAFGGAADSTSRHKEAQTEL